MGQLPNEPEETDDELVVEGPDGTRMKLELPDLGDKPQRDRPEYHAGDSLVGRRPRRRPRA
jgi:hypothetical protein